MKLDPTHHVSVIVKTTSAKEEPFVLTFNLDTSESGFHLSPLEVPEYIHEAIAVLCMLEVGEELEGVGQRLARDRFIVIKQA